MYGCRCVFCRVSCCAFLLSFLSFFLAILYANTCDGRKSTSSSRTVMTQEGSDDLDALAALSSVSISLSASFPLPFRILVLVSLGAFCWALNLHVLHLMGIDTAVVLDIRSSLNPNEHIHPSTLYPPVYQLAACLAVWTGACWILGFQVLAGGNGESAVGKTVAVFSLLLAAGLLFLPADRLKKTERMLLIRSVALAETRSFMSCSSTY